MNKLEEARKIINEIDEKMLHLFEERMHASKMVAEYKKENGLPVFDGKREQEIISNHLELLKDKKLAMYYLTFFDGVLTSSKDYQKDLLK
ncbi:MAG: chorismate mutase [Anaeroplasmataceae bacterium]|nr:chorismate mutase [Anaeroplasmataceae bacterium]